MCWPDLRPWADDLLALAGVVCIGVGLHAVAPPWALWFYAGVVLLVAGWMVSRC